MTLATYIGRTLGAFRILKWQRSFLSEFERTRGDVALSLGRGSGKTALCSAIACAVVDPRGPLHGRGFEVVAAASSFTQGKLIFEDALDLLRPQIEKGGVGKGGVWRVQDSANFALLEHRPSGARLRCIGSDPKRMMGLRPKLAIGDEISSWENAKIDKALSALRTSLGKVPGSRFVAIGTRPEDSSHPFQKMLDGIGVELAVTYAATDPDNVTWASIFQANPSLWAMPDLRLRIRDELKQAKLDPSLMAAFKSLRLNGGVSETVEAMLISAETWKRIETSNAHVSRPYVLGIDLGATAAMSSAAGYSLRDGALETIAILPADPDLGKRGVRDGVADLYVQMHARGELHIAGQYTSDPAALLRLALEKWGRPVAVVADRQREGELREALMAARFPMADLVMRGQGFKDGAADVRLFQRTCVDGKVAAQASLLLRSALSEARTIGNPAGDYKLAKGSEGGRRKRGRDDAAAASLIAVAEGQRRIVMKVSTGRRRSLSRGVA